MPETRPGNELSRRAGRANEAARLDAQRSELWSHWMGKLANVEFLIRQSLTQITPAAAIHASLKQ